jgi:hypothetical protein
MDEITPTEDARKEAKLNPNGYVYVIDKAFDNKNEDVPPTAILGAWKVDENGEIIGDFIKNSNYINLKGL